MKIVYLKRILKDVKKIKDIRLQKAIENTVAVIKNAENLHDVKGIKKISGHPQAYRIRIGAYRLGFYVDRDTVILARLAKRNDIYKLFP